MTKKIHTINVDDDRYHRLKLLRHLAIAPDNDIIGLLMADDVKMTDVKGKDLTRVTGIRRDKSGALELTLVNRIDAVNALCEAEEIDETQSPLVEALHASTHNLASQSHTPTICHNGTYDCECCRNIQCPRHPDYVGNDDAGQNMSYDD